MQNNFEKLNLKLKKLQLSERRCNLARLKCIFVFNIKQKDEQHGSKTHHNLFQQCP